LYAPTCTKITGKIDLHILCEPIACRKALTDILDSLPDLDGAQFNKLLNDKSKLLFGLFRGFDLEKSFWKSMQGEVGFLALQSEILAALPSTTTDVEPSVTLGKLGALQATPLFKYCGIGPQSITTQIIQYVTAIKSSHSPEWVTGSTSTFMSAVKERLAYCCRAVKPPATDKDKPETLVGAKAAAYVLETVRGLHQKGTPLTLRDVQPLITYDW
jgi:hypothetical protein